MAEPIKKLEKIVQMMSKLQQVLLTSVGIQIYPLYCPALRTFLKKIGRNYIFIQFSVILHMIFDIFGMVAEALELEWPKWD